MLEIIRRAVAEALSQWQLTDYTPGWWKKYRLAVEIER